jgi:hypothetical protein
MQWEPVVPLATAMSCDASRRIFLFWNRNLATFSEGRYLATPDENIESFMCAAAQRIVECAGP